MLLTPPCHPAGLASVTFRALAPERVLALAAAAGLDGIEWGADVHAPPSAGPARLRALGAATRAAGLAVLSYGSYHRLGADAAAALPPVLDAASALGAPLVRVWAGDRGSAALRADTGARDRLFAAAREGAALAAARGLALSLEWHPDTFTDDPAAARELLAAVPGLRTHWQPRPDRDEAWNLAALGAAAPRLSAVHAFHWTASAPPSPGPVRRPLAEDAPAWRRRVAALPPGVPVLLEFLPGDDPALLPREAAALREILRAP